MAKFMYTDKGESILINQFTTTLGGGGAEG